MSRLVLAPGWGIAGPHNAYCCWGLNGRGTRDCGSDAPYVSEGWPTPSWSGDARCEAHVPRVEETSQLKDSNPKDAVGIRKVPASVVPREVLAEVGLGLLEGALKYGRHNYRAVGVRASVYFDASMRHLDAWWEGQDIDPDSGLSHVSKAIATLVVLRDAMINGKWTDDRPPMVKDVDWVRRLNEVASALMDKYPEPKAAYTKENT